MQIDSGIKDMHTDNKSSQHLLLNDIPVTGTGTNQKQVIKHRPIEALVAQFRSHGLDEIQKVDLMNRVDTKFLMPINKLEKLMMALVPFYAVLEIDFSRLFHYQTTYYDTPGYGFYLMHHNGKQNRLKFRHRLYVETGDRYAEVKRKTNKGTTVKDRVEINGDNGRENGFSEIVSDLDETIRTSLSPSLICSYVRIALSDGKRKERLTLDYNLSFSDPDQTRSDRLDQVLIAEVKRKSFKSPSRFMDVMKQFRYKPVSFSKYCIGCALLYPGTIKTNRFKPTLKALSVITNNRPGKGTFNQSVWQ